MSNAVQITSPAKQVTIVDVTIPVVEYQGQRVVTLAMIDHLHKRPEGTASRNFQQNKDRLKEGYHFHVVDFYQNNEFRTFEIEIPPHSLSCA